MIFFRNQQLHRSNRRDREQKTMEATDSRIPGHPVAGGHRALQLHTMGKKSSIHAANSHHLRSHRGHSCPGNFLTLAVKASRQSAGKNGDTALAKRSRNLFAQFISGKTSFLIGAKKYDKINVQNHHRDDTVSR